MLQTDNPSRKPGLEARQRSSDMQYTFPLFLTQRDQQTHTLCHSGIYPPGDTMPARCGAQRITAGSIYVLSTRLSIPRHSALSYQGSFCSTITATHQGDDLLWHQKCFGGGGGGCLSQLCRWHPAAIHIFLRCEWPGCQSVRHSQPSSAFKLAPCFVSLNHLPCQPALKARGDNWRPAILERPVWPGCMHRTVVYRPAT